jgi:hypothetical protein
MAHLKTASDMYVSRARKHTGTRHAVKSRNRIDTQGSNQRERRLHPLARGNGEYPRSRVPLSLPAMGRPRAQRDCIYEVWMKIEISMGGTASGSQACRLARYCTVVSSACHRRLQKPPLRCRSGDLATRALREGNGRICAVAGWWLGRATFAECSR